MSYNQLKIKDIEQIYEKIYFNACELIEDAELLYDHNRYARAYLAAQIAFEELGKLPMLYTTALNLYNGIDIEWKDLNFKLRNHKAKTSLSLAIVMMFEKFIIKYEEEDRGYTKGDKFIMPKDMASFKEILDNDLFSIDMERFYKAFKDTDMQKDFLLRKDIAEYMNDYKNHSLYADFKEGVFLMPSEIIDRETCRKRLQTVLLQKKYLEMTALHKNGFRLYKYEENQGYSDLREIIDEKIKGWEK